MIGTWLRFVSHEKEWKISGHISDKTMTREESHSLGFQRNILGNSLKNPIPLDFKETFLEIL